MRECDWCRRPLITERRGARFCGRKCRQAAFRLRRAGVAASLGPGLQPGARFAYADPPYPGFAHLYRDQSSYAGEVDHAALVSQLETTRRAAGSDAAKAPPRTARGGALFWRGYGSLR